MTTKTTTSSSNSTLTNSQTTTARINTTPSSSTSNSSQTTSQTTTATTTYQPVEYKLKCRGVGKRRGQKGIVKWCESNCRLGMCPSKYCKCKTVIVPKSDNDNVTTTLSAETSRVTNKPTTPTTTVPEKQIILGTCRGAGLYKDATGMAEWCNMNCARNHCPVTHCICDSDHDGEGVIANDDTDGRATANATTTTTESPSTKAGSGTTCVGIGKYAGVRRKSKWCTNKCSRGKCPVKLCKCTQDNENGGEVENENNINTKTCRGAGSYRDVPGMEEWCTNTCATGNCPKTHCVCNPSNGE